MDPNKRTVLNFMQISDKSSTDTMAKFKQVLREDGMSHTWKVQTH
jgi:hypothetical protein